MPAKTKNNKTPLAGSRQQLLLLAAELIQAARTQVARQTNSVMVFTYYHIGRLIIEQEQQGNTKAAYGKATIKALSKKLSKQFGKGFSERNIELMRSFYLAFSNKKIPLSIPQTVSAELPARKKPQTLSAELHKNKKTESIGKIQAGVFPLSWSHYVLLLRIENIQERSFYEIESIQNNWSVRELQRQTESGLFERLALSKDKRKVKQLAARGQVIEKPEDVLKKHYVLEFLGLDEKGSYTETELETAIISKIEHFLLEMGKGFLFHGRQVRFTIEDENFYVDLVLYNRLLQCFVLVDLKIGKLKHQDIGQMQMYVNYYDRFIKKDFEKPSIGIIICKDKTDAIVEITLPEENRQIFASQYKLYLPTRQQLKNLIRA